MKHEDIFLSVVSLEPFLLRRKSASPACHGVTVDNNPENLGFLLKLAQ